MDNEFVLINEITNYIENKEKLFQDIKLNEISINSEKSNVTQNGNFIANQEAFNEFFKLQLENNIKIGSYYNTQISKVNSMINKLNEQIDMAYLEEKKRKQSASTNEKKVNIEYNNIVVNKLYQHLLLVSLIVIITMCCLVALNKYNFIQRSILYIIQIILSICIVAYIIFRLYSSNPRQADDYYRFKFD